MPPVLSGGGKKCHGHQPFKMQFLRIGRSDGGQSWCVRKACGCGVRLNFWGVFASACTHMHALENFWSKMTKKWTQWTGACLVCANGCWDKIFYGTCYFSHLPGPIGHICLKIIFFVFYAFLKSSPKCHFLPKNVKIWNFWPKLRSFYSVAESTVGVYGHYILFMSPLGPI